jgi:hypothetical protein
MRNRAALRAMTQPDVRFEGVSVVLRGSFNPAIMSPGWLLAQSLVSEQEHDASKPEAIVPNLSVFTVGAMRFQVTPDVLTVETENQREFERTADLVTSMLTILPHTPVNMLGINHFFHAALPSPDSWHRLGDKLTPKDYWSLLTLPGTRAVALQGVRPDRFAGAVNVEVQPSGRVAQGIFISQNDHFILREVEQQPTKRTDFLDPRFQEPALPPEPSAELVGMARQVLAECWTASYERADAILALVVALGESK